ncbi:DUF3883 domain-containing protein [Rhizobium leguminosarum]|uniref:DUF3883 domain-containing protein n=1 Tax=Rhizobium leguminosarum TaxID=384 RepID=UPI003F9D16FB
MLLKDFVSGGGYRGHQVQIFLASKYYQAAIPAMGDGTGAVIGEIQALMDELYRKQSVAETERCISVIFRDSYQPKTGVNGSNNWRNALGLQKAGHCNATVGELSAIDFVTQPRKDCPHLVPGKNAGNVLDKAQCELRLGPTYRGEDAWKLFRYDEPSGSFSIVQPDNIEIWRRVLCPKDAKLPLLPLIIALYYDSIITDGRTVISPLDFLADFNFSLEEYSAYFDDSLAQEDNAKIVAGTPQDWSLWDTHRPSKIRIPVKGSPVAQTKKVRTKSQKKKIDVVDLPELPQTINPPAGGHWWSAERGVADFLKGEGWSVKDATKTSIGYDFHVKSDDGTVEYFVEVKSSAGSCTPTLTQNELDAARKAGERYVLAVVEHYDPEKPLKVYWVRDPASLDIAERSFTVHAIRRSSWRKRILENFRKLDGDDNV